VEVCEFIHRSCFLFLTSIVDSDFDICSRGAGRSTLPGDVVSNVDRERDICCSMTGFA
jgi:hypothetical protein